MVTMSAFFTSLVTSLVVFVILVILFSILSRRPSNAYIYYPNRILHGQEPPDLVKKAGVFTWIKEAYSATDAELVAMGGLDAWVYTYFFTTGTLSGLCCSHNFTTTHAHSLFASCAANG
jgi:hypothetical protein